MVFKVSFEGGEVRFDGNYGVFRVGAVESDWKNRRKRVKIRT